MNVWAGFNGCQINHDTIHNDTDYTHIKWRECNYENELNLYLTRDGGHSWPGGVATPLGAPVSKVINANDLMWTFFQQHSKSCSANYTGNINTTKNRLTIYPNPFNKATTLQFNRKISNARINIFNASGQKVKTISKISRNKIIIHRDNLLGDLYFIHLLEDNRLIATKNCSLQIKNTHIKATLCVHNKIV